MGKKKSSCEAAARRAWRRLRIILLWAQEGGLLKCRLMAELRHMPKQLKGHYKKSKDMIQYGERQLSFDETPMIHFRMSRPSSLRFKIPCISPEVTDFDYDFSNDGHDYDDVKYNAYGARRSFLGSNVEDCQEDENEVCEEAVACGDSRIDDKADEFIAQFYEQMKLLIRISTKITQQPLRYVYHSRCKN